MLFMIWSFNRNRHAPQCSCPEEVHERIADGTLLAEAKALGINVSQAAEEGLASAVSRQRRERWLADNHEGVQKRQRRVRQARAALGGSSPVLMARFSVHQLAATKRLVLNVQSDLLDGLSSRMVIPLVPMAEAQQALPEAQSCIRPRRRQVRALPPNSSRLWTETGSIRPSLRLQLTNPEIVQAIDFLMEGI